MLDPLYIMGNNSINKDYCVTLFVLILNWHLIIILQNQILTLVKAQKYQL